MQGREDIDEFGAKKTCLQRLKKEIGQYNIKRLKKAPRWTRIQFQWNERENRQVMTEDYIWKVQRNKKKGARKKKAGEN